MSVNGRIAARLLADSPRVHEQQRINIARGVWATAETVLVQLSRRHDLSENEHRALPFLAAMEHEPASAAWLKWRHAWAHGYGEWHYLELDQHGKNHVEGVIAEIAQEHSAIEGYRGISHAIVSAPPREWLLQRADELRQEAARLASTATRYQALVEIGELTSPDAT